MNKKFKTVSATFGTRNDRFSKPLQFETLESFLNRGGIIKTTKTPKTIALPRNLIHIHKITTLFSSAA